MVRILVDVPWSVWGAQAGGVAVRSLLVLALGMVVFTLVQRRLSAAGRHLLLLAIVLSLLPLPLLSVLLPSVKVPILPVNAERALPLSMMKRPTMGMPPAPPSSLSHIQILPSTETTAAVKTMPPTAASPGLRDIPTIAWVLLLWGIGALVCGVWMLGDLMLLRRLSHDCPIVQDTNLQGVVAELARQTGLRRTIILRQSRPGNRTVLVPITWGWFRSTLLLPSADVLAGWPEERLRAVLLHELAHIRRFDWMTQQFVRVACSLYWFNPLVWIVARRIQRESEQACDDQVLRAGIPWADYAAHLVEVARLLKAARGATLPVGSAQAMAKVGSPVEARVRAILDVRRNRRQVSRRMVLSTLVITLAFLAPLAVLHPGARAAAQPHTPKLPSTTAQTDGPRNLDFKQGMTGWSTTANGDNSVNGNYGVDIDLAQKRNGIACAVLQSAGPHPQGYGVLRQDVPAEPFRGKRIRFAGYLKTDEVREYSGLLVSLLNSTSTATWAMTKSPLLGTTDWRRYEYVIDVPKDCRVLMLGVSMKGLGKVWASEFTLETVGIDIPVTKEQPEVSTFERSDELGRESQPRNLNFSNGLESWNHVEEGDDSTPVVYRIVMDPAVRRGGAPMPLLTSDGSQPNGYGTMVQYILAKDYRDKRIRLSGFVRTAGVKKFAGLWMLVGERVWDAEKQPLRGDTDWTKQSIVVDVPKNATDIGFGTMVRGIGKVWASDLKLEIIDKSVPVTRPTLDLSSGDPAIFRPQNLTFEQGLVGWSKANPEGGAPDYRIGTDRSGPNGRPAAYLTASVAEPKGYGTLLQYFRPMEYHNRRIRFSARLRTEGVRKEAGLWLRMDLPSGSRAWNMDAHPIKGTTAWRRYEYVLDVPSSAVGINFGIDLDGPGKVWTDGFRFEIVGNDVPLTPDIR